MILGWRKPFLFALVLLAGARSLAIGEIERVVGWGLNAVSYGTILPEIENQKQRIKAQYAVKMAEVAQSIEIEKNARLKILAELDLAQTRERLDAMKKMLKASDERSQAFKNFSVSVEKLRSQQENGNVSLQNLLETARQDLDLKDVSVSDLKSLRENCLIQFSESKKGVPLCAVLQMLSEEAGGEGSANPLELSKLNSLSRKLQSVRLQESLIKARLSIEIESSSAYVRAAEKRLSELK